MDPFEHVADADKKQLAELGAQIDALLKKGGFHPIVKDVLFLLHDDQCKWIVDFKLERLELLQATIVAVDTTEGTRALCLAIRDLFRAAAVMWNEASARKAATVLYALLEKIIVERNLLAVVEKSGELSNLDAVKDTVGLDAPVAAPKLGEAPPKGSVTVDKLAPKRRI